MYKNIYVGIRQNMLALTWKTRESPLFNRPLSYVHRIWYRSRYGLVATSGDINFTSLLTTSKMAASRHFAKKH